MFEVTPIHTNFSAHTEILGKSIEKAQNEQKQDLALEKLEHLFNFMIISEMRKSVPEGGLFGGSSAEKMFQEFLDDALSAEMAKGRSLGIADLVEKQLRAGEIQNQLQATLEQPESQ